MTLYLSNRDGNGKTNEEGHYRLLSKVLAGEVLTSTDLQVTENSPLAMNVLVKAGDYRLETSAGYSYMGWNSADATVTISTADGSNPRITVVVLYIDKAAATSASPPNNPGIAKLMAVDGTPSGTPTAPSGAAIQTAVGAGNPYMILANVAVGAGVTQITNANITDFRDVITLNSSLLPASTLLATVGPLLYPVGSIYTNGTDNTNPATLLGFGTWSAFGQGRVLVSVDTGDPDFGTLAATGGAKTVTLSEAQMPNHTHAIDPPSTTTSGNGNHNHRIMIASSNAGSGTGGDIRGANVPSNILSNYSTTDSGNHTHSVNIASFTSGSKGGGSSHTNLQPYVTVYMWRRTA